MVHYSNDLSAVTEGFLNMSAEEAMNSEVPLLFISFPSTKDSTHDERYPGVYLTLFSTSFTFINDNNDYYFLYFPLQKY